MEVVVSRFDCNRACRRWQATMARAAFPELLPQPLSPKDRRDPLETAAVQETTVRDHHFLVVLFFCPFQPTSMRRSAWSSRPSWQCGRSLLRARSSRRSRRDGPAGQHGYVQGVAKCSSRLASDSLPSFWQASAEWRETRAARVRSAARPQVRRPVLCCESIL